MTKTSTNKPLQTKIYPTLSSTLTMLLYDKSYVLLVHKHRLYTDFAANKLKNGQKRKRLTSPCCKT